MNDIRDISPIQQDQLQYGVQVLEKRRNRMRAYMFLSGIIVSLALMGVIFSQSLVYAYFDIFTTIQQLHIPVSASEVEYYIGQQTDHFYNLLAWIMWLGIKIFVGLIGASLFIYFAKKIKFLNRRMSNFGKRILGWFVTFMLIWTAMTLVQSEINDDSDSEQYIEFIAYDHNIQTSDMYHYLQRNDLAQPVQNYLLAQTALLHQPADKDVALAYASQVVEAEQTDPKFLTYGFKPEQLWSMQHQLYGHAVTPLAKTVDKKFVLADRIAQYTQWVCIAGFAIFLFFMMIFYVLVKQFNTRLMRIEDRLIE